MKTIKVGGLFRKSWRDPNINSQAQGRPAQDDLGDSTPAHLAQLRRLFKARGAKVLIFEPDCGLWPVSNTTIA